MSWGSLWRNRADIPWGGGGHLFREYREFGEVFEGKEVPGFSWGTD